MTVTARNRKLRQQRDKRLAAKAAAARCAVCSGPVAVTRARELRCTLCTARVK